ncbi:hypothetical protein ES705_47178 [subsurface metagenome]
MHGVCRSNPLISILIVELYDPDYTPTLPQGRLKGLAPGWYCVSTYVTITADFYHPDITVYVYADDVPITPWGVVLTGPCEISYGDYFVKRKDVRIVTTNNTATDAVLSELCYGQMLEKSFYEEFYAPIIEYMHAALQGVARG